MLTHAVLDALRRVPPGASGHLLGTRGRDGRPDHARFATRDPERTDGHAAARALARAAGLVVLGRWTAGPAPRTAPDALEPGLHLVLERLDAPLDGTLDGALDPSRAGGPPDRGAAAADAVPRAWRGHAFLVRDDGRLERAPLALLDPRRRPAPEER